MIRAYAAVLFTLTLVVACSRVLEIPESTATDPTADFDVLAPDIDTQWPDGESDTGDTGI